MGRDRSAELRRRLDRLDAQSRCIVLGCPNPTRAAASEGFDVRFCRRHHEHYQRHGSPYRASYSAAELVEPRKWAAAWLKLNDHSDEVGSALERVRILYRSAGVAVPAFRLRGLSAEERARKAWARLRDAQVPPERILAAWLAVQRALATDPEADSRPEFARVQAAKLVHRLASGTRKTWVQERLDGGKRVERIEVYPRSRGKVLRVIGEQIEDAAGPVSKLLQ